MGATEKGPVDEFSKFLDRYKVVLFGVGVGSLVLSWYATYRMASDIRTLKKELARIKARPRAYARMAGAKGKTHVLGYRKRRRS